MNIINANNLKYKSDLLVLLQQMPNKAEGCSIAKFSGWLDENLGKNDFGFWLAYHQEKSVGLIACEITNEKTVFVSFFYVSESIKNADVAGDLFKCVENWTKQKGLHKIFGETIRLSRVRAFMKKFNVKVDKIIISKEV